MDKVEKFVIKSLLAHGFTQEEIDAKTPKELREIYSKGVSEFVQRFSKKEDQKNFFIPQNPFENLQIPEEIFDLAPDFFKHFAIEDLILMIHKRFHQIPIDQIQKIVAILLFSFQENLLMEIENKLTNVPQDELESIMEIYEFQRNDIKHLMHINQKLELESFREKLGSILRLKIIIREQEVED